MSKFQSGIGCCVFFSLFIIISSLSISAQSTIYNVPSTDVVPEKLFYVEADFIGHFDDYRKGGFQSYGYRTVYGVTKKLEVGANFFYTRSQSGAAKEFQPNIKWKAYENEKHGVAVATGAIFFVPLDKQAGTRTYGSFYSTASKMVKGANGLRLTGGGYTVVGAKRDFGTKNGVILGVEQPIKQRLSLLVDWYSGKNRFGYSAAGFGYGITKRQYIFAGYNFGNSGRANNAFSAFYGFTF